MMESIGKMVVKNTPSPWLRALEKGRVGNTNSSASYLQQKKPSETERIPQIMGNLRYPPPPKATPPQEIWP